MKLWRKLLAAVTAGTICLGSIGAMLSVSAETESDFLCCIRKLHRSKGIKRCTYTLLWRTCKLF